MWKAELVLKRKIRSRSHRVGIVDVGTYMPVGEGKEERERLEEIVLGLNTITPLSWT